MTIKKKTKTRSFDETLKYTEDILISSQTAKVFIIWSSSDLLLLKFARSIQNCWERISQEIGCSHDGHTISKDDLQNIFEQGGLFTRRNLHLVVRCEKIRNLGQKLKDVISIQPSNHVLLLFESTKQPKNILNLFKNTKPEEISFTPPRGKELRTYVLEAFRRQNFKITADSIEFMIRSVGDDLIILENAINTICMEFAEQKQAITKNQIAESLGVLREDHAFKVQNYLLEGKRANAQILIEKLLDAGSEPLSLLGILARHVRNSIELSGIGAQNTRLPAFVRKQYGQYLKRKEISDFALALHMCQKIDRLLKSNSKASAGILLTQLINILLTNWLLVEPWYNQGRFNLGEIMKNLVLTRGFNIIWMVIILPYIYFENSLALSKPSRTSKPTNISIKNLVFDKYQLARIDDDMPVLSAQFYKNHSVVFSGRKIFVAL